MEFKRMKQAAHVGYIATNILFNFWFNCLVKSWLVVPSRSTIKKIAVSSAIGLFVDFSFLTDLRYCSYWNLISITSIIIFWKLLPLTLAIIIFLHSFEETPFWSCEHLHIIILPRGQYRHLIKQQTSAAHDANLEMWHFHGDIIFCACTTRCDLALC